MSDWKENKFQWVIGRETNYNKLALFVTDGQLFTTDVSAKLKVT